MEGGRWSFKNRSDQFSLRKFVQISLGFERSPSHCERFDGIVLLPTTSGISLAMALQFEAEKRNQKPRSSNILRGFKYFLLVPRRAVCHTQNDIEWLLPDSSRICQHKAEWSRHRFAVLADVSAHGVSLA